MATARRIAARTGYTVLEDMRLRERGLGILEGLTRDETSQRHPEVFAEYSAGGPDFVVPGGESTSQRLCHAVECLEELGARHAGAFRLVTWGDVNHLRDASRDDT
ncbi:histidine phosphatase family protein [Archangium minus]|uniref:Histidine phosphatase family protein n=1 Tax=Archangium minus TaxID=83450 RepID=A0ABY9X4T8_9BACT|nr:histidine phosphatase family protein [Archangium minus]